MDWIEMALRLLRVFVITVMNLLFLNNKGFLDRLNNYRVLKTDTLLLSHASII